jgi:aminopeptidase N
VLDMFEAWIGEEPFRLGVRQYLKARESADDRPHGVHPGRVAEARLIEHGLRIG